MAPFQEKRFLPKRGAPPEERERLTQLLKDRLARDPDVLFAYLHGSFAAGEAFRDIDIGVFVGKKKDLSYESCLSYELSTALGQEVEVRVINDAPVAFQMAVLTGGTLLVSRDDAARVEFIESVGRRYREYAHFRNIFREAVGAER
jgi:predicted nucleotidyltransferase